MKNKLSKIILPLMCLTVGSLAGCNQSTINHKFIESDTLYVKKVDGMADDFILGMDVSSVLSEEASGVKYYNFEGEEADLFEVLADSGVNYIRVRVWNNPFTAAGVSYGGGNNDINAAVEIGKRATKYGMKLLVDFHYSDFWADPGKQKAPKAWAKMTYFEKLDALYEYTESSLQLLKDNKIDVGMVQVGNETNGGKMAGETRMDYFCGLVNQGSKAVKKVYPGAKVAVHFANPEKTQNYFNWAQAMSEFDDGKGVNYDVFGSSYYPYWHGTLENLQNTLSEISEKYHKKTMVMETSYCFSGEDFDFGGNTIGETTGFDAKEYPFTIAGQANHVRAVTDTIVHTKGGIGVCYWEGAWIPAGGKDWETNKAKWEQFGSGWAAEAAAEYDKDVQNYGGGGSMVDNQTFFDKNGKPLESLKVWGLMRRGNEGVEKYIDGVEDAVVSYYTYEDFELPAKVKVVMNDNSKEEVDVVWSDKDIDGNPFSIADAKAFGNAKYTIPGKAQGRTVYCYLTVMEMNFVQNYGFEDSDTSIEPWKLTLLNDTPLSDTYKITSLKSECNALSGGRSLHFWGNGVDVVNFEIEQTLNLETAGTYKYQVSIMGSSGNETGTADPSYQDIYAYVKINGEIQKKVDGKLTKYQDWSNLSITGIVVNEGDVVSIGVHMDAKEKGTWGDIDDAMFNFVS